LDPITGTTPTISIFVRDPDDYRIELIERG
jgi:hypothetical protein